MAFKFSPCHKVDTCHTPDFLSTTTNRKEIKEEKNDSHSKQNRYKGTSAGNVVSRWDLNVNCLLSRTVFLILIFHFVKFIRLFNERTVALKIMHNYCVNAI